MNTDRQELSRQVRDLAAAAGFQLAGMAPAEPTPVPRRNLQTWLREGRQATMEWIGKRALVRGDIHTYFPPARSVVVVGLNYFTGRSREVTGSGLLFSNYAWGDDYHAILKSRLQGVLKTLQERISGLEARICVDTSPVMEKVWAQRAGLGWQGKHTCLITREYGSWVFLGVLILNLELEYDTPVTRDACGTCTACLEACPTGALESYRIDARKCLSYLTIEHRGPIPAEYRDRLQDWVMGCDLCQEVCPWNRKFEQVSAEPAFHPRPLISDWERSRWEALEEAEFNRVFRNSPVRRTRFAGLKRNIALT